jgi:hypothetical protein
MGNFAALVGCPSKEAAQTQNHWSHYWDEDLFEKTGWGPVWLSKYCIGGFWLGCFSPEDEILIDRDDEEDGLPPFVGYFTSIETAIERLTNRKTAILSLTPEGLRDSYSELYDTWVQTLSTQFKTGIFLDCDDIFGMIGHEEGSDELRRHVARMASLKPDDDDFDVIDFGLTGLLSVGEISANGAKTTSAEQLAKDWQYSVTADPAVESEAWPPEITPAELVFAKKIISDTLEKHSRKSTKSVPARKPWWKFW